LLPEKLILCASSLFRTAGARCCFYHFAAADASGAHANALAATWDCRLYRAQVHIPTTAGLVVGVAYVISKLRAFAAYAAYLCHDETPELF
jgi:hypothetical protein